MSPLLMWVAGCACNPGIPSVDDDVPPDTGDTPTPTDTGPPPRCAHPEAEPNNTPAQANELVLEQRSCGVLIGEPDVFAFEVVDAGWIEVEAERDEGSIADLSFILSYEGVPIISVLDGIETPDARIAFVAPTGRYTLAVSDQNGGQGDRFTYRVLVSEIKAPVEWNLEESEPNDGWDEASILVDGDAVFGTMIGDGPPDTDWYRISIPGGRHDLRIDVDAREHGSGTNLDARIYDEDLVLVSQISGGPTPGVSPDPDGVYASTGAEVLFVQLLQQGQNQAENIGQWYVLGVTVEAR